MKLPRPSVPAAADVVAAGVADIAGEAGGAVAAAAHLLQELTMFLLAIAVENYTASPIISVLFYINHTNNAWIYHGDISGLM